MLDQENTDEIDVKLEDVQKELLRLANSKGQYEGVAAEIYRATSNEARWLGPEC